MRVHRHRAIVRNLTPDNLLLYVSTNKDYYDSNVTFHCSKHFRKVRWNSFLSTGMRGIPLKAQKTRQCHCRVFDLSQYTVQWIPELSFVSHRVSFGISKHKSPEATFDRLSMSEILFLFLFICISMLIQPVSASSHCILISSQVNRTVLPRHAVVTCVLVTLCWSPFHSTTLSITTQLNYPCITKQGDLVKAVSCLDPHVCRRL